MNPVDLTIFIVYFAGMLGIGFYFLRKNKSQEDYYVGGRDMSSLHVGLSVVATDVGGGFSIGLGGLGFVMGISGSWMLFTGLIGAWLSAVFLIPKVSKMSKDINLFTFPQIFGHFYDAKVALLAGIISAIGYLGFTSSQLLAGAKLASASFEGLNMNTALIVMGLIAVVYTVMGGLKAVIYTDTVQWIILLSGLIFIGLPVTYHYIGGYEAIVATLDPSFLEFTNITWQQMLNWTVTIVPIWFVGMTLYQRIYACRGPKEAQRAWFIAGLFEWPIMALLGVCLGMFAKVAAQQGAFSEVVANVANMDPELGLPLLLKNALPVGLTGLMMSAYFSAIMSTADSCLMASSGNVVSDILVRSKSIHKSDHSSMRWSQWITLGIGLLAIVIASTMTNVLDLMLYSYAFMVSGLLIPIIGALYWENSSPQAAFWSMLLGGSTTLILIAGNWEMPYGMDPNIYGIAISALVFIGISAVKPFKSD